VRSALNVTGCGEPARRPRSVRMNRTFVNVTGGDAPGVDRSEFVQVERRRGRPPVLGRPATQFATVGMTASLAHLPPYAVRRKVQWYGPLFPEEYAATEIHRLSCGAAARRHRPHLRRRRRRPTGQRRPRSPRDNHHRGAQCTGGRRVSQQPAPVELRRASRQPAARVASPIDVTSGTGWPAATARRMRRLDLPLRSNTCAANGDTACT
jgi:hypothetical protein